MTPYNTEDLDVELDDVFDVDEAAFTCLPLDHFSGETCLDCGATSNQLLHVGYWCKCGFFNIATSYAPLPVHATPDFGVSADDILKGYERPNLWVYGDVYYEQ